MTPRRRHRYRQAAAMPAISARASMAATGTPARSASTTTAATTACRRPRPRPTRSVRAGTAAAVISIIAHAPATTTAQSADKPPRRPERPTPTLGVRPALPRHQAITLGTAALPTAAPRRLQARITIGWRLRRPRPSRPRYSPPSKISTARQPSWGLATTGPRCRARSTICIRKAPPISLSAWSGAGSRWSAAVRSPRRPRIPVTPIIDAIILLSDGLNTLDRWYGNGSSTNTSVDARMYDSSGKGTCANIKATGVTIYTVQVNTGGDPTSLLLKNCASSSDKFYLLTSASQIIDAFTKIGTDLSQLRVAK